MDIQVIASGSRGNCYRVDDGKTPLLLEAGISLKSIKEALGFKTSDIAGCLISHEHGDHAKAATDVAKAGIDCYLSAGTAEALGLTGHRAHIVKALERFQVGTWTVLPFDAVHDAAEPLGFLLATGAEKLLFATDTAYIKYRFNGLTHIMIECNYDLPLLKESVAAGLVDREVKRRTLRSHMNLQSLKELLRANDLSRVQEIILLHLSDNNSDSERFKREIQELTGKVVRIA